MRAAGQPESTEPPTTRLSAQPNAASAPVPGQRPPRTPAAPQPGPQPPRGGDREIESWLSELRGSKPNDRPGESRAPGNTAPPPKPSADTTRAMPVGSEGSADQQPPAEDDATTAIPTAPREQKDPDVATQKLNARGNDPDNAELPRQRRGGLSAQDLLRREGRI